MIQLLGARPLGAQTPQQPVAQELKAYYFYECATAGCKCPASHNGGPNKACSRTCRDAFPCSGASGGCHVIPEVVPEGRYTVPMPTSKRELSRVYCALGHIGAKASTVYKKWDKTQQEAKLWEEQCTGCDLDAEGDSAGGDDRLDAASAPGLVSNSSSSGSDGVSEDEVVEVPEPAPAPAHAPRTPAPSRALRQKQAEKAARDAGRAEERQRAQAAEEKQQRSRDRQQAREQAAAASSGQQSAAEVADSELIYRAGGVGVMGSDIALCLEGVAP